MDDDRDREMTPSEAIREKAESYWRGRVKPGDEFEYLGRKCVVTRTIRFCGITSFVSFYSPEIGYEYADKEGVIRSGVLREAVAERLFPKKEEADA